MTGLLHELKLRSPKSQTTITDIFSHWSWKQHSLIARHFYLNTSSNKSGGAHRSVRLSHRTSKLKKRANSAPFFYCLSVVVVPIFKFLCTNLKSECKVAPQGTSHVISTSDYQTAWLLLEKCALCNQVCVLVLYFRYYSTCWLSPEGECLIEVWLYLVQLRFNLQDIGSNMNLGKPCIIILDSTYHF